MFSFFNLLAQATTDLNSFNSSYGTGFTQTTTSVQPMNTGITAILFGALLIPLLIFAVLGLITIIGEWKMFKKAGKPGWASIIPIYNTIVLLEIVGRPIWWFLLMFIPIVNIVVSIIIMIDLAKSFGKDTGFAVLLILLPFIGIPMLGFGNAQYAGSSATGSDLGSLGSAPTPVASPDLQSQEVPAAPIAPPTSPEVPAAPTPTVPPEPDETNQTPPTPPTGPLIQ